MYYLIIILVLLVIGCSSSDTSEFAARQESPIERNNSQGELTLYRKDLPVAGIPKPATSAQWDDTIQEKQTAKPMKLAKRGAPQLREQSTDAIMAQLTNASMAFTLPEKANIDDEVRAHLLIDANKTVDELAKSLGGDVRASNQIKVSKIIVAKLVAPDFVVTPITPEEQALTKDESTEWIWDLQPKTAGLFTADLVITAVVQVGDKASTHSIKTFSKKLTIDIRPQQAIKKWFKEYWQWIVGMVLSIIGWVAKYYYFDRKKPSAE